MKYNILYAGGDNNHSVSMKIRRLLFLPGRNLDVHPFLVVQKLKPLKIEPSSLYHGGQVRCSWPQMWRMEMLSLELLSCVEMA